MHSQTNTLSLLEGSAASLDHARKQGQRGKTGRRAGAQWVRQDITGMRFSFLVVLCAAQDQVSASGQIQARWMCLCDCGRQKEINGQHLKSGKIKSCGCFPARLASLRFVTHGMSDTLTYNTWQAMKTRCSNPRQRCAPNYVGRGIKVCERWNLSFENFLSDMGPRPSSTHSIDRIDNDGNYEPGNCRWATALTQANNSRSNLVIEMDGVSMTVAQWAREFNFDSNLIYSAKYRGKTPSESLRRIINEQPL